MEKQLTRTPVNTSGDGCCGSNGGGSEGGVGETDRRTAQRVAAQLGYGVEPVRSWVRQADIDRGVKQGFASN